MTWLHSGQPTQTCSTKQVEQQRLGLIFAVVCNGNAIPRFAKPFIAKVASRHFDADAALLCNCLSPEMPHRQRNILLTAKFLDKGLVAVGLFAPQMEIAVQGMNSVAQLPHDEQEGCGVCTAADGNMYESVGLEPNLVLDVCSYLILHLSVAWRSRVLPPSPCFH